MKTSLVAKLAVLVLLCFVSVCFFFMIKPKIAYVDNQVIVTSFSDYQKLQKTIEEEKQKSQKVVSVINDSLNKIVEMMTNDYNKAKPAIIEDQRNLHVQL